jgi:hypothetical protein
MKKISRNSPILDGPSKTVLVDIAQQGSAGAGVNATYYRAQHSEYLDLLDKLERVGFLRKELDRYWVTFQGLILLKDEKSNDLFRKCENIFAVLQQHYKSKPKTKMLVADLSGITKLSFGQVAECLGYMCEFHFMGSHTTFFDDPTTSFVEPAETILRYSSFKEIVDESILLKQKHERKTSGRNYKFLPSPLHGGGQEDLFQAAGLVGPFNANNAWTAIKSAYDTDKKAFGRRIRFVSDAFKREIIFRDVAQSFLLAEAGFSKPAVILAGSVLEELLRLFLEFKGVTPIKDTFDGYIRTCVEKKLLKSPVHQLTDSVRQFRNLVHLEVESSSKHTISKATAKGAVSSIFTIVNDIDQD